MNVPNGCTGAAEASGRWIRRGGRVVLLPAYGYAPLSGETAWEGEVKPPRTPRREKPAPTRTPTPRPERPGRTRTPTPRGEKPARTRTHPPRQGGGGAAAPCDQPIRTARTFADYVALVRQAETALIGCGHKDMEQRLHMLSGIYYGTEWSRDYQVEKNSGRNLGFQVFLAKRYGSGDDPRPCLGCGLFESLRRSGDAGGVDMGHVLIGMSARMRFLSRYPTFPPTGSTGLEITTWVGDLGGATAKLALDRIKAPGTPASKYFRGRDYGAASNLEGDIAAYLVATTSHVKVGAPEVRSGLIADALNGYFVIGINRRDRCRHFLTMMGGVLSGGKLTNHADVRATMAGKLASFGLVYLTKYLHQRGRDLTVVLSARPLMAKAAEDVAELFITKLLACRF